MPGEVYDPDLLKIKAYLINEQSIGDYVGQGMKHACV